MMAFPTVCPVVEKKKTKYTNDDGVHQRNDGKIDADRHGAAGKPGIVALQTIGLLIQNTGREKMAFRTRFAHD
jgi:hypothetical protein